MMTKIIEWEKFCDRPIMCIVDTDGSSSRHYDDDHDDDHDDGNDDDHLK